MPVCSIRELLSALPVHCQWCCCIGPRASTMLSLLHASMLHASPAEPGLRPARPHGKPVATPHKRGEHIQAGRVYKRGAPTVEARTTGKARTTWRALTVRGMLDREFNGASTVPAEQGVPVEPVRGMHRRFSWDALNVTSATDCGWHKCYFPSQREEDEGWLVGRPPCLWLPWLQCRVATGRLGRGPRNQIPEMGSPTRWFPPYTRAWALAEELRAGFGVDHLMRGPPLLATLPEAQATIHRWMDR